MPRDAVRRYPNVPAGASAPSRVRRRPEFERAYDSGAANPRPVHDGLRHAEWRLALHDSAWRRRESSARPWTATGRNVWPASCSGGKDRGGLDIVVVPRREMLDAPFASLEADYLALLARRDRAAPASDAALTRRRSPRSACFARISCFFLRSLRAAAASSRRVLTTWPNRSGCTASVVAWARHQAPLALPSARRPRLRPGAPPVVGPKWNAGSFSQSPCLPGAVRLPGVPRAAAARPSGTATRPGRRPAMRSRPRTRRAPAPRRRRRPLQRRAARRVRDVGTRASSFDTAKVEAVLTNRGGRLLHWRLKDYLDDQGEPVDLVPSNLPATEPLPFSLQAGRRRIIAAGEQRALRGVGDRGGPTSTPRRRRPRCPSSTRTPRVAGPQGIPLRSQTTTSSPFQRTCRKAIRR